MPKQLITISKKDRRGYANRRDRLEFVDVATNFFELAPSELPFTSSEFFVGFVRWQITLKLEISNGSHFVLAELKRVGRDHVMRIKATGRIGLVRYKTKSNSEQKYDPVEEAFKYIFTDEQTFFVFTKKIPIVMSKRGMAESPFFKNGKFKVGIQLKLGSMKKSFATRFDSTGSIDFYRASPTSNVCINVRGKNFFVQKEVLSTFSDYFFGLFNSEFLESRKEKFPLDADPRIFHEFLCLLYPTDHKPKLERIDALLELADRFLCPYVTALCLRRLLSKVSNKVINREEKLVLADKHNLVELKAYVLRQLAKNEIENLLSKEEEFKPDTQRMLHRRLELMNLQGNQEKLLLNRPPKRKGKKLQSCRYLRPKCHVEKVS